MRTIPPDIGTLTNLTKLKMSDNILVQLPKEIGELVELQYVDLCQNELQVSFLRACSLSRARSLSLAISFWVWVWVWVWW